MPPFHHKFIYNNDQNTAQFMAPRRVHFNDYENALPANPTTMLDQNARNVMDATVSDKTRQRKLQYAAEFLIWAANQGLTEEDILPPSENTLCNFAALFAGKLAGGTTKAKVSVVKNWMTGSRGEVSHGKEETTYRTFSMALNTELLPPHSVIRDLP
ncbi:hypothetical protein BT96DRAFT_994281 [Gymnopus androsaceus JB14]|uniref:Uncharacterized protein n=1 Tax=Gymnopus androsaceus JB14 TaxID=1447944 RepID=A0A6A4HN16_9AGAR|nr:hypothetical protein BT96DRAFT_994281 [Gymnopus androsaceus JB14]